MLDVLRRQASSWLIKIILLLIIASFAFFFGFTELQSRLSNQQNLVARVENQVIPRRKFDILLDDSLERAKESFEGKLPENIEDFLRSNLLEQLVSREAAFLFAQSVGIRVSDASLAQTIRENDNFKLNGVFDSEGYHTRFLPSYKRTYGEEFEISLKKDLTQKQLFQLAEVCFGPWQSALDNKMPEGKTSLPPGVLLSHWVTKFRDQTEIDFY